LLWVEKVTTTKPLNQNKMKAIFEFNLPEDQHDFEFATQGGSMYSALWDISQELRKMTKYDELSDEEWKIAEKIKKKFHEILDEHSIKLNK